MDIDSRFWVMFMDVYRQLLRGDYDKPYPIYLELLNFTLPELLGLLPAEEPARLSLLESHYDRDTKATVEHLRKLLDAYISARNVIIRRYNLGFYPDHVFEDSLRRIVERDR